MSTPKKESTSSPVKGAMSSPSKAVPASPAIKRTYTPDEIFAIAASDPDRQYFVCEHPTRCPHQSQILVGQEGSRGVVSDLFGRNKGAALAQKRQIIWCLRHYQLDCQNNPQWQFQRLELARDQLVRNEEDHPGITYWITLKKNQAERVLAYINDKPDPKFQHSASGTMRGKSYNAPLNILMHIHAKFVGKNRSVQDCRDLLDWIAEKLRSNQIRQVPHVEMMPFLLPASKMGAKDACAQILARKEDGQDTEYDEWNVEDQADDDEYEGEELDADEEESQEDGIKEEREGGGEVEEDI